MDENYVWYAAYGSNLNTARFYTYLDGTQFPLSTRKQFGCRDNDRPVREDTIQIPYELYFSKKASGWENKGVAFLKSMKSEAARTLCKIYLINKKQFTDVFLQENSKNPFREQLELDFTEIKTCGEFLMPPEDDFKWYGRLIYLTDHQGIPVITFTAKWNDNDIIYSEPGDNYLKTIIGGIRESFQYNRSRIVDYLAPLGGIKNNRTRVGIEKLIR